MVRSCCQFRISVITSCFRHTGTYYSNQLTSSDIDCTSDVWSAAGTCTETFCDRLSSAESQVSFVMSIPYVISAACSPPMARDYYSTDARNE